ncbi:hypothetical protein LCGC14_1547880 [marine sediment metagenome]|uniref:Uncharacterized protein n=1 Tax=marine sediment metagenome TaxID=412755 RepID=A0A0F9JC55_9ZZZZ
MEWISVKDRLPEMQSDINYYTECPEDYLNKRVLGGRYIGISGGMPMASTPGMSIVFSHWQYSPKAPKE